MTIHPYKLHTNNIGCEKTEAHEIWSVVEPEKAVPVTQTTCTLRTIGPAPVNSRQGTPSVHNCVTRLLGTDPMAVDGICGRRRGKRAKSRE